MRASLTRGWCCYEAILQVDIFVFSLFYNLTDISFLQKVVYSFCHSCSKHKRHTGSSVESELLTELFFLDGHDKIDRRCVI